MDYIRRVNDGELTDVQEDTSLHLEEAVEEIERALARVGEHTHPSEKFHADIMRLWAERGRLQSQQTGGSQNVPEKCPVSQEGKKT